MKQFILWAFAAVISSLSMVGCRSAQDNVRDLRSTNEREMTVGIVQREIKKGMSGAAVAEALGSPNIVTKDEGENVTWVYDKIATEASYSQSQNALFLVIGGVANQSGAASVTQKTLTVVIKFDANDKVSSFTYHSSKF
jgi:outer membrane protein assembly factor BamE (lipoprotein component of BamABCDE complex)